LKRLCFKCTGRLFIQAVKRHWWRHALNVLFMRTAHPAKHSKVVDACVDVGIIDTVEYINREICPTRFSCQGGKVYGNASVTVSVDGWERLRPWLDARGYSIGYTTPHNYGGDIGMGIKRPIGVDISVWDVSDKDAIHVDFVADHNLIFAG
jgi:hypothetical protein